MVYDEEVRTRALYDELYAIYAAVPDEVHLSLQGAGAHWNITITRVHRSCSIGCFQTDQHYIYFAHTSITIAVGRTAWKHGILQATHAWLYDANLHTIHEAFPFVDHHARAFFAIHQEITRLFPELTSYSSFQKTMDDSTFDELWFSAQDRACRLCFYGEDNSPDTFLYWDECELVRLPTHHMFQVASIIKRWIQDYAMPSVLEHEYPWLVMDTLAQYYEQGRGIEGEFMSSWDKIETFYQRLSYPFASLVQEFIRSIRHHGYDRELRVGQSLWNMIVSRSRRHGLRRDQAYVCFNFHEKQMDIESTIGSSKQTLSNQSIAFTSGIEALLKQLAGCSID
jgi:hypothetical protein